MDRRTAQSMTLFVVGLGVALTAGAFVLASPMAARSVAVGATIAVVNWFLLRWMVGRAVDSSGGRGSVGVMLLPIVKMGLLMGLSAVLMLNGIVAPIAFGIGLSALVGGLLFGSFLYIAGGFAGSQR